MNSKHPIFETDKYIKMSNNPNSCPNCGSKLKGSILSTNAKLDQNAITLINLYHKPAAEGYCNKCGHELHNKYSISFNEDLRKYIHRMRSIIHHLPVVTIHHPVGWDYTVMEMVTGQSVGGTGITAEITSSFSDLFGSQNNTLRGKLQSGEILCTNQLRKNALDLGANAVIATDIDYAELGTLKGMIMVCMSGTAIKLNNPEILGEGRSDMIKEMIELNKRLKIMIPLSPGH